MKVLLLGAALLAGCAPMFGLVAVNASDTDVRPPQEMAPDRKVNEQDCSKPVDHSAGNIRCK